MTVLIGVALAVAFQQGFFVPSKAGDPNKNIVNNNVKPPSGVEPKPNGATTTPPENNIPPKPTRSIRRTERLPDQTGRGRQADQPDYVLKKILQRVCAENGSGQRAFPEVFKPSPSLGKRGGPEEIAKDRQAFRKSFEPFVAKEGTPRLGFAR